VLLAKKSQKAQLLLIVQSMRGGVAMGKEDAIGSDKEFNTGRTEGICYEHKKDGYR